MTVVTHMKVYRTSLQRVLHVLRTSLKKAGDFDSFKSYEHDWATNICCTGVQRRYGDTL